MIQSPRFYKWLHILKHCKWILVVEILAQVLRTILLFIDSSKMARIRINTTTRTKEKPYIYDKFVICANLVRQKSQKCELNTCIYVSKLCAEGIFVSFPGDQKKCEKDVKNIFLFSNERHFKIYFPKMKKITFLRRKLSVIHMKETNFACDYYIFPKTRENKSKQMTLYSALKVKVKPWFT